MAAGSISAPTVIPLRIPTSFSQSKLNIDTDTPIELNSSTPNVKIYYTINGVKPNPFERDFKKSSTFPYTSPFTLSVGKHTIKALAIEINKQAQSGTVTKIFTVSEPQILTTETEKRKVEKVPQIPIETPVQAKPAVRQVLEETTEIKPSILSAQSPKILSRPNSGRQSSVKATSITFEDSFTHAHSQLKLSGRSLVSNRSSETISAVQDTIKLLQETNYLQCIFCFCPRPADPYSRYCPQCGSSLPILPSSAKDLTMPPPGTIGQCLECKCSVPLNLTHCVVCEASLSTRLIPQSSHILKEKLLCLACGTANPDGTLKCVTCENYLVLNKDCTTKIKNIADFMKCPFCSGFNARRNIFCVACGYRIKPKNVAESDSDRTQDADILEDKNTETVATQTQGIFFPSSKSISLKYDQQTPAVEEVKKRENKTLKPYSPGNGYWRQQTDHICGHLRSYIQSNADFQQVLGQPAIGRIKTITLHTDDQQQAVMQILFNLKPQSGPTTTHIQNGISKLRLDEEDSISSETNGIENKTKKVRQKSKKISKVHKSVDDHLLLKEVTGAAREQLIEQLIEGGANVNSMHAGKPILNKAIEINCISEVTELLLRFGADVNLPDKNGNTSLHTAVNSRDCELLKLLLEHNGDPLLKNDNGDSVYMLAANHEEMMQTLSAYIGSNELHTEVTSKQNLSSLIS